MSDTDTESQAENADELADLAADAESIEPNTSESGEKLPAETEQQSISNEDAVAMALGPLFQILAPNWQIQPSEIEQLAQAYAPVLDKYMPGDFSLGVEMQAVMVTAIIIAPRAGVPRNEAAAKRAEERRQAKAERQQAEKDRQQAKEDATAKPADDRPPVDMSGISDDEANTPGVQDES